MPLLDANILLHNILCDYVPQKFHGDETSLTYDETPLSSYLPCHVSKIGDVALKLMIMKLPQRLA
jgi:hypothetical protein